MKARVKRSRNSDDCGMRLMLTATQHLAHHRVPPHPLSFCCPSDSCAGKSRSRAFLNLSESALSMRRCISSVVSRSPLDCLNSTFSKISPKCYHFGHKRLGPGLQQRSQPRHRVRSD